MLIYNRSLVKELLRLIIRKINPQIKSFVIQEQGKSHRVNSKDVLYLKSDGNYLNIYLENKRHIIRSKMDEFTAKLPSNKFVRVHQRYNVHTQFIDLVGSDHLSIKGTDIPVSAKYKKELTDKLNLI